MAGEASSMQLVVLTAAETNVSGERGFSSPAWEKDRRKISV